MKTEGVFFYKNGEIEGIDDGYIFFVEGQEFWFQDRDMGDAEDGIYAITNCDFIP